jgi:hypothetical protein
MLRYANVYLAQGRPAIVAAAYYNIAGIGYEQEDPLVVAWGDEVALTEAVNTAVGLFCLRDRNLRDSKRTEWPAFIASKCKSASDFERTYQHIHVGALNSTGNEFEASAKPPGEPDIRLCISFPRIFNNPDLGRQLYKLYAASAGFYDRMSDLL